ncbi:MAG: LLM class F420-dependent oxidoreductase, partial [Actinobacteria bacterium]|nr:LLM class F420-dependent oxidoreductase [Actinomycetota bacterium]
MKYGIHLPNSGAFADPELVIEIADLAERSSLESVWVFDHILTP